MRKRELTDKFKSIKFEHQMVTNILDTLDGLALGGTIIVQSYFIAPSKVSLTNSRKLPVFLMGWVERTPRDVKVKMYKHNCKIYAQ